jgi:hypothetical protein
MTLSKPSRVRILFDDGVCEEIAVSFVGECLCRLEQTPIASSTEARLGDVVEFDPEDGIAKLRRIVERSPYETLTWIVPSGVATSEEYRSFISRIEGEGGRVEQAFGGTVLVHVSPSVRPSIQEALEGFKRNTR